MTPQNYRGPTAYRERLPAAHRLGSVGRPDIGSTGRGGARHGLWAATHRVSRQGRRQAPSPGGPTPRQSAEKNLKLEKT